MRFNAFVYKLPTIDESQVTKAAQLLGLSNSTLNSTERALLTNRTTDLASIPIPNANNVTVQVVYNGRNVSTPVKLQQADNFGEIDQFQVVPGLGNMTGNSTQLQNTTIVQLYAQGYSGPGNGSSILVPETGRFILPSPSLCGRLTFGSRYLRH